MKRVARPCGGRASAQDLDQVHSAASCRPGFAGLLGLGALVLDLADLPNRAGGRKLLFARRNPKADAHAPCSTTGLPARPRTKVLEGAFP